ncbi:MAG: radical SAM protein [Nitrospira sp.]|nr:radical SAM protein [Nitrospira sp.]
MSDTRPLPIIPYGTFSQHVHDQAATRHRVIKAQLELTYRCNLHCRHCYTDPYNDSAYFPRELTLTEIQRLLGEMRNTGIIWLNLTGGDIFMRPDFFDIYEAAIGHGFLLQLYTNGTLFTRAIIERLQAHPPFSIDISCHSVDESQFDWFTQVPGSYRAFLRGIALLQASGLPFSLKTKLMNWNAGEMDQLRRFTESNGQTFGYTTSLSPRLNGDGSSLDYRIAPDAIHRLRSNRDVTHETENCPTHDPLSPPAHERLFRCGCGTDTIHINAWGELSTCTFQYETRLSLRTHTVREAIEQTFAAIPGLTYQTDSACRTCTLHTFCDKQPTQARWETGHPESPIPYDCDVAFARAESTHQQPLIHPLHGHPRPATATTGVSS